MCSVHGLYLCIVLTPICIKAAHLESAAEKIALGFT